MRIPRKLLEELFGKYKDSIASLSYDNYLPNYRHMESMLLGSPELIEKIETLLKR